MATTTAKPVITIEFFQFIRTYYQTSAVYSSQANSNSSLNKHVLLILLCLVQLSICSIAFLLFDAKTIGDLAYSYCATLSILLVIIFLLTNAVKTSNILMLIEKYDEFIRKSQLNLLESIRNQMFYVIPKIERM